MDKPLSLEYLAGLFDGEGYIMISRWNLQKKFKRKTPLYQLKIGIEITDPSILVKVQVVLGGSLYTRPKQRTKNKKRTYTWYAGSNNALRILEKLIPHLHIKRRQAILGTSFQKHLVEHKKNNSNYRQGLSKETLNFRENIVQQIRKLNSNISTRNP